MAAIGNPGNQMGQNWWQSPAAQTAMWQIVAQMLAADPSQRAEQNFGNALLGGIQTYTEQNRLNQQTANQRNQQMFENIMARGRAGREEATLGMRGQELESALATAAQGRSLAAQKSAAEAQMQPTIARQAGANVAETQARTEYLRAQREALLAEDPVTRDIAKATLTRIKELEAANANRQMMGQEPVPIDYTAVHNQVATAYRGAAGLQTTPIDIPGMGQVVMQNGQWQLMQPTNISTETAGALAESAGAPPAAAPGAAPTTERTAAQQREANTLDNDKRIAIGRRVEKVLTAGGQPSLQDLQLLERDARARGHAQQADYYMQLRQQWYNVGLYE